MAKLSGGEKYLSVAEASKIGRKEQFYHSVREKIIPRLIQAGRLKGKKIGKAEHVLIDADFHRMMRCGIESFVYGMQGWTFSAINAPFDATANALQALPEVSHYEAGAADKSQNDQSNAPANEKRIVFLVQPAGSKWPVLVQTVHWFMDVDALLATLISARLSAALQTQAVAAWDDDFSGSTAVVCENGAKSAVINDEENYADFYSFFYDREIALPSCFIRTSEDGFQISFDPADPKAFERVDRCVLTVPKESRSKAPHVFEKLGAMAQAIELDLEDESAFRTHMVDQLWARVDSILKAP